MTRDILFTVLNKLIKVSRKSKVKIVLMGGLASSIFARPRATYDIDGIASLREENLNEFLTLLKADGFKFEEKRPLKFIQGMPFLTFYYSRYKTYVDLFIAKNKFQNDVLKRARKVRLKKLHLYVVSPEDLILIKLQTGREKDLEDVRDIISVNKSSLDFKYLEAQAKKMGVYEFLKDEERSLGVRGYR
ncbi:MAG: nucleotidyltransferase [Candidatus Omnitrophota bacterium]